MKALVVLALLCACCHQRESSWDKAKRSAPGQRCLFAAGGKGPSTTYCTDGTVLTICVEGDSPCLVVGASPERP